MVRIKITAMLLLFLITILGYQAMSMLHVQAISNAFQIHKVDFGSQQTEKERYLMLIYRRSDKNLFMSTYVEPRKERYDIRMFCLEEESVSNNQNAIRKFLQKTYQYFPFTTAAFSEDIVFADRIRCFNKSSGSWKETFAINDIFYCELHDNSKEWHEEFTLGRILRNNLKKVWTKAGNNKIGVLGPFWNGPRKLFCSDPSCEPTPVTDPSLFGQAIKDFGICYGLDVSTFYDNRSKNLELKNKPDFVLSKKVLQEQEIEKFPCLISWTTAEPYNPFDKRPYYESYPRYPVVETFIWDDKDQNGSIDNYNAELTMEEAYTFNNPENIKKIGIVQVTDRTKYIDIATQFYAVLMQIDTQDPRYWHAPLAYATDYLLSGRTIGEAGSYGSFDMIVFGPPETTLKDVMVEPKITIKATSQATEEISEIVITGNKTSFFISNAGDKNLTYKIISPDNLDITPVEGTVSPYNYMEIIVSLSRTTFPFSIPHKKQAIIIIESNDPLFPKREIKVRWLSAALKEWRFSILKFKIFIFLLAFCLLFWYNLYN